MEIIDKELVQQMENPEVQVGVAVILLELVEQEILLLQILLKDKMEEQDFPQGLILQGEVEQVQQAAADPFLMQVEMEVLFKQDLLVQQHLVMEKQDQKDDFFLEVVEDLVKLQVLLIP